MRNTRNIGNARGLRFVGPAVLVLAAAHGLGAQATLGPSLQTADFASQLQSGIPVTIPSSDLTTSSVGGSSYPSLGVAPLYLQAQPAVVWSSSVGGAHSEVTPPLGETATARLQPGGATSFARQHTAFAASGQQQSTTGGSAWKRVNLPLWAAELPSTGDPLEENTSLVDAEDGDRAGVDSAAAIPSSMPVELRGNEPTTFQQTFASSCLDSPRGCSDPTVPILLLPRIPLEAAKPSALSAFASVKRAGAGGQSIGHPSTLQGAGKGSSGTQSARRKGSEVQGTPK